MCGSKFLRQPLHQLDQHKAAPTSQLFLHNCVCIFMENNGNTLGASLLEQEIPTTKSTRADTLEITDHAPSSGAADAGPTVWTKKKVILFTRSVFIDGYYVFMLASATGLLMCALWPLSENLGGNKIQLGNTFCT